MIPETESHKNVITLHPEFQHWKEKDHAKPEAKVGMNWRLYLLVDGVVHRRAGKMVNSSPAVEGQPATNLKHNAAASNCISCIRRAQKFISDDLGL